MDLRVAVVAWCDAVVCTGVDHLFEFELAVGPALLGISGLEKTAAAAAAEIVGSVGMHVNVIFLPDHCPDHKSEVFGNWVAQCFPNKLAGILDGELDL